MVPHTCFTGRLDSNSHQLRSTLGVSELHNITYVAIFYRFHLPIRIRSSNQCHGSSSYASINQVSLLVLSFTETKRAIVHEAIQLFDSHIIYMLFESNGISPSVKDALLVEFWRVGERFGFEGGYSECCPRTLS